MLGRSGADHGSDPGDRRLPVRGRASRLAPSGAGSCRDHPKPRAVGGPLRPPCRAPAPRPRDPGAARRGYPRRSHPAAHHTFDVPARSGQSAAPSRLRHTELRNYRGSIVAAWYARSAWRPPEGYGPRNSLCWGRKSVQPAAMCSPWSQDRRTGCQSMLRWARFCTLSCRNPGAQPVG